MAHAMLNLSFVMLHRCTAWRPGSYVVAAAAFATLFASTRAFAQTTTTTSTSGPTIQIAGQSYPNRILPNGTNLGESTRPQGLNPFGISYEDCITDQTLQFPLIVSGFNGQNLEVWASIAGDCTQDANRGLTQTSVCWPVGAGITGLLAEVNNSETINVRVQDIVGLQNASPAPTVYERQGPSACNAQPSFTPVAFTLYFIPVLSSQDQGGTPYEYQVNAGLVGPPAPVGVGIDDGDTVFIVNWTPNADSATIGYNLFIDPPLGSTVDAGTSALSLVCDTPDGTTVTAVTSANVRLATSTPDGSEEPDSSELAIEEGGAEASLSDAAIDATLGDAALADATAADATASTNAAATDASLEASCHYAYVSGTASTPVTSTCNDPNLTAGTTADASVEVFEEAGADGEVTTTTTTGSGGISQVNSMYAVPVGADGLNASGEATGSYTLKGLTNGITYTLVVSAVDDFGNVGPPSNEACDYPAPVNDFWTLYRAAGGQAGGLCALEAVGAPVSSTVAFGAIGAMCIGFARRRRRGRR